MVVNGYKLGTTRDYVNDWNYRCGETLDRMQDCRNHGLSSGDIVVPYPHSGNIVIELSTTASKSVSPFLALRFSPVFVYSFTPGPRGWPVSERERY